MFENGQSYFVAGYEQFLAWQGLNAGVTNRLYKNGFKPDVATLLAQIFIVKDLGEKETLPRCILVLYVYM